jgi:hypothetical protein
MTELVKKNDGRNEDQKGQRIVHKRAAEMEERSDHFTPAPPFACNACASKLLILPVRPVRLV